MMLQFYKGEIMAKAYNICFASRQTLLYRNENNYDKNMPEFHQRITLGCIPKVIYFTKSVLNLNIQSF